MTIDKRISNTWGSVHVEAVTVVRIGQIVITLMGLIGEQITRQIGQQFVASFGIESVQHAIIGSDIY